MNFSHLIFIASMAFLVGSIYGNPIPADDKANKSGDKIGSIVTKTKNHGEGVVGEANEDDLFDDNTRFNLNTGLGIGVKQNPNNQFGIAKHDHFGYGSAIKSPDGHVTNLGQYGHSGSSAWNTGHGAPNSFASGGSQIRPGYSGGQTTVGGGGHGTAFAQDQSSGFGINLPNGNTYLSNLKT